MGNSFPNLEGLVVFLISSLVADGGVDLPLIELEA
jgi:hypothetical protein